MGRKGGRHELKYRINYADFLELRTRLALVAAKDQHAANQEGYHIRSLYFDNYEDKALKEKIDGVNRREKFRLRFYNQNPSLIKLEKKSKEAGICFKENELISAVECARLIEGEKEVLKQHGSNLSMELYTKMQTQQLRPKTIVDYQREAFAYPVGNVRITLDYDIRVSYAVNDFFNPELVMLPGLPAIILEVKYDHFLPEIIRGIVALSDRQNSAFSKYAITRVI